MAAVGTVLSVAQTVCTALQTPEVRMLLSLDNKSQHLPELEDLASSIEAVLKDAEDKEDELKKADKDFIRKLYDALLDLEDVLDEHRTIIQRDNLQCNQEDDGYFDKITKTFDSFLHSHNMSKKVEELRDKLDAIVSPHKNFGLSAHGPSKVKRKETWSYVNDAKIIGREKDKETVVDILLRDTHVEDGVSFLTIAAMGGMGKTALAQLVYEDDSIKKGFPERYWVCVSEEFELQHILRKMIRPAPAGDLGMEDLQKKVREQIKSQRFLLVLDDVWCDKRLKWVDFIDFFATTERGGKILITSRNKSVADAMKDSPSDIHDLAELSVEHSRKLFARIAFGKEEKDADPKLVEIGHEIVERSPKVPLAIRVMGGMLYGQQESKWQAYKEGRLHCKDEITAILKLSYNNLTPPLKSCFTFCAVFPKDHELKKDVLINLWAAQGYIEPQYEGECIEDVGEEYFIMLCNRCFFQEIHIDDNEVTFKMHDLMHDLAEELLKFHRRVIHKPIPHRLPDGFDISSLAEAKTLRTLLCPTIPFEWDGETVDFKAFNVSSVSLIVEYSSLRVLDLRGSVDKNLPDGIDSLIHLRYLDLADNQDLEELPESLGKLYNLQVLILNGCKSLEALPRGLSKLVNLRVLLTVSCDSLCYMPAGMGKLTCLRRLNKLIVGGKTFRQIQEDEWEELKVLANLRNKNLTIDVRKFKAAADASRVAGGGYLLSNPHVKRLRINFKADNYDDIEIALLEGLQPNTGIEEMELYGFKGKQLPPWITTKSTLATSFPFLWNLELDYLPGVRQLPSLSRLPSLKHLKLSIRNVEFMEEGEFMDTTESSSSSRDDTTELFFPSLEELWIREMPKLKGWWRIEERVEEEVGEGVEVGSSSQGLEVSLPHHHHNNKQQHLFLFFPLLKILDIHDCPNLKFLPPCPQLQELKLSGCNKELSLTIGSGEMSVLKKLVIDKLGEYNCLTEEALTGGLRTLIIDSYLEESFSNNDAAVMMFQSCSSSLQHLQFRWCRFLKSIPSRVLLHLPNLKTLSIYVCDNFGMGEKDGDGDGDGDDDDESDGWKSLQNLTSCALGYLPKLVNLPKGIQYLPNLHELYIYDCNEIKYLPEWLTSLTSLKHLQIQSCSNLKSLSHIPPDLERLDIRRCPNLETLCHIPPRVDLDIWGCPFVEK